MSVRNDPPIELQTAATVSASIIWLHGLGADGHDFPGIVPELRLPPTLGVRFVFPHAPYRPVTLNNGYVMRAWYDMAMAEHGYQQNIDHLTESVRSIHSLIEREQGRGVAPNRIIVAGFSQGGVVALHSALRFRPRLAGGIVLSAPVFYINELLDETAPVTELPLFLGYGTDDGIVPFVYGEQLRSQLQAAGWPIEWHVYDMEHSVCLDEILDIGRFIARTLG